MSAEAGRNPDGATPAETVLVVDDNAELRIVLRKALERAGYRVLEAGNGEEALALIMEEGGAVDVVLSDVVMPRMGGRELVWRLGELTPEVQVVLLSGVLQRREALPHLDTAPAAYIEKPFDLHEVVRTVRRLIDSRSASGPPAPRPDE